MLKCAMIFTDKMVLQREKEIPVWGQAEAGKEIEVSLVDETTGFLKSAKAVTEADGSWMAKLPACDAAVDLKMTVTDGNDTLTFCDVCIGEVWIAGGQSNMEYLLAFEKHFDEVKDTFKNPNVRFFDYPEVAYEGQLKDYDYKNYGFWRGCTPEDFVWFSSVGFYVQKELHEKLNVPVGIVGCNWGGTTACAWMDPELLKGTVGEFWVTDYEKALEGLDVEAYKRDYLANPGNNRTDELHNPFSVKMVKEGSTREEQLEMMLDWEKNGESWDAVIGPYYERRPGGLYETMLKKIVPYGMRGAIWYQGESDSDKNPEIYETVFSLMIKNWRELWQEEFPFLFVQLAPFKGWLACDGENYPYLRQAQDAVSKKLPRVWMASIGDVGMEWDIHPKNKKAVGERLALLARGHVYGETDLLCDAPEAVLATKKGEELVITFENAKGLHIEGERLNALKGVSYESARVEGNQLILSGVSQVDEVQFAKEPYYEVNLFNEAHIPAKPFSILVK